MRLIKLFVLSLFAMVLTACGGGDDSGLPSQGGGGETLPAIVSLQVTPAIATVPVGLEQQYVAEALLEDGSVKDVTTNAALSWRSSNPAIATIDSRGLATGVSPGDVTITASGVANGVPIERSVSLTVSDAVVTELQVTPANSSVPAGLAKQFIATAYLSDGSTRDVTNNAALSWSSDALSIATISNATDTKGQATGVAPGDATITASGTANGTSFSATATLTVTNATVTSLQVTPFNRAVPIGLSRPFTATATLSDGSSLDVTNDPVLSWSSSAENIATITSTGTSGKGVATGVAVGITTITASGTANGQAFSATQQLTVTDAKVTSIQVTPAPVSVGRRQSLQMNAIGTFSDSNTGDITSDVAWQSDNTDIATVRRSGLLVGVEVGTTSLTANSNGVFSNNVDVTVNPWVTIDGVGEFSVPDDTSPSRTWPDANSYCSTLSLDSGSAWRLPTIEELIALYSAYPRNHVNSVLRWPTNLMYWSSTPSNVSNVYDGIYMTDGYVDLEGTGTRLYVTCFRKSA
ncbi:Ig-like domain-containing protein [Aeromonas sp. DNP9]|uniref:Ig-like domain-containing protein n=1 Tax=Aeromonas sp. DNP9 TaxID=1535548 RepID=UPI0009F4ED22|nr:Ig-like domain-containing protein [Aeromonas sp. DNP9]